MENAGEAIKMAGSVLLFVIALSIAILTFTQARETVDSVIKYTDRESLTIQGDNRFYYLSNDKDTNRYVGKETIIPTIYRAYKENYKIIFEFPEADNYYLFETAGAEVSKIDLAKQSIGSDLLSRKFLNGILYGDYGKEEGKTEEQLKKQFIELFRGYPHPTPLYEYLTKKEKEGYIIMENLGTYYMEDIKTNPEDDSLKSGVEEVNKQEKRVITYTLKHK